MTLVELLIVVVIIGVLVSVAVPVYNGVESVVEQRVCQANLRILDGAAQQYWHDHSIFPSAPEDLEDPAYLMSIPACPTDGRAYDYNPATGRFSCDKAGHFYPE